MDFQEARKPEVEMAILSSTESRIESTAVRRRGSIYWRTLPGSALLHSLGALACVVGAAIFVQAINGQPQWQTTWTLSGNRDMPAVSPQVILSLLHAVSAFELALAWTKGSAISWWRRAGGGLSVNQLEWNYRMSTGLKASIVAGRKFNWIGMATIAAATVGLSQGPLLQKSLSVVSGTRHSNVTVTGQLATALPFGYTSVCGGHDVYYPNSWTLPFLRVMKAFNQASPITTSFQGCNGTCLATVTAIGLAPQCTSSSSETLIWELGATSLFSSSVLFNSINSSIEVTVSFATTNVENTSPDCSALLKEAGTDDPDSLMENGIPCYYPSCTATMINNTCVLRPAVVEYPVIIKNDSNNNGVFTIDTNRSPFLDVVRWTNITDVQFQFSTLGGVWLALNEMYAAGLATDFSGEGWSTYLNGTLANEYMNADSLGSIWQTCALSFEDPTTDILNSMNNIMLRTAIMAANASYTQTFSAQQTSSILVYAADNTYLAVAVGITILGVLFIIPLFWGWWQLQKTPTMSPVEVAEAFGASVLGVSKAYKSIDELLAMIGHWRVKYEEVSLSGGEVGEKSGVLHRFTSLDHNS